MAAKYFMYRIFINTKDASVIFWEYIGKKWLLSIKDWDRYVSFPRRDWKLPESPDVARARARLRDSPFLFLASEGTGESSGARVNPAQTTGDKQRRAAERFMLSARGYVLGMFGRAGAAPRIPEACWIASQTHSLAAPLCYCCQGGGRSTDVISAPWQRSREKLRLSTDFFFSLFFFFFITERAKELFFSSRRRHARDAILRLTKGTRSRNRN